jgi:hypothetical protein
MQDQIKEQDFGYLVVTVRKKRYQVISGYLPLHSSAQMHTVKYEAGLQLHLNVCSDPIKNTSHQNLSLEVSAALYL